MMLIKVWAGIQAGIQKEWLLLFRDKLALAILFIMPMFFVLVISLLQSHNPNAPTKVPLLVASQDQGALSQKILQQLKHSNSIRIINIEKKFNNDLNSAKHAVATGKYQGLIIFPKAMTKHFEQFAKQSFVQGSKQVIPKPFVSIYLDPTINPAVKTYLTSTVTQLIQQAQIQAAAQIISGVLGTETTKPKLPQSAVSIHYASLSKHTELKPDPIQQNVPAWAIFGMFFIVVPLSSIIIKERELKIGQRLAVASVSIFSILTARLLAFSFINLLQLVFMLLVGVFILPLFGLPALKLLNYGMLILTAVLTAMAASSFGIFIGTFVRTYEQASSLGPLLVVLAAALGGIMLPTYLMPNSLQFWSAISPLNWAQSAFVDIFVRQASFALLAPQLAKLLIFSCILLGLVCAKLRKMQSLNL